MKVKSKVKSLSHVRVSGSKFMDAFPMFPYISSIGGIAVPI